MPMTPEEKKGLIGEGLAIREEKQTAHPYHRLEALNARAGRPVRLGGEGSEWCVYRDVGTGAEVWKMTDMPTNEWQPQFNCDGSAFTIRERGGGGFHVFDWQDRSFKLMEGGLSDARPRFSTTEPDVIIMAENEWLRRRPAPSLRRLTLHRCNFRTGEKTKMAQFETSASWRVQELYSSPDSSRLAFGFRETPTVFLIDPEIPQFEKRCREITLPTRLKGVRLANNDTELQWNNCYTYQRWLMDLKTGKVFHGNAPCAGGHAAGGPHWTIGPYGQLMKLLVKNGLHPQTEATADDTRIFANYKTPVVTDYGFISANGKWMVTNGTRGDVQGQHLMIPIADPGTVLRVCHYNTSRNDWCTNTYSSTSPDATKLAWVSDQLGNGDIYIAITGRPAAPRELKALRQANGDVKLSWQAPSGTREIGGYRIYRSRASGWGFEAMNGTPVTATGYTDRGAAQAAGQVFFYVVAAVEPCGLEGTFSNEAAVDATPQTTRKFYLEAEDCQIAPPLRLVLDGSASGSRYVRYHRASPDEPDRGTLKYQLKLPPGNLALWTRCRNENKDQREWYWVRLAADPRKGSIEMSADGPSIDRIAVSNDAEFNPDSSDAATPTPGPVTGLAVADATPQSVTLRWNASPVRNIARYDVHVGGRADKLGNETIIGSTTETTFKDWGLRPGTAYTYHVVAVDSRGRDAKPVSLKVTTAPQLVQTVTAEAQQAGEKVSFPIDVAAEAPFLLWVKYQPAYVGARQLRVGVEIDGKAAGTWQLRAPYRLMSGTLVGRTEGEPRVFVDKVLAGGKDVFTLSKGRHTVTFILDPTLGDGQHAFAEVIASNDHSYRPPGYDPRADFKKAARRY